MEGKSYTSKDLNRWWFVFQLEDRPTNLRGCDLWGVHNSSFPLQYVHGRSGVSMLVLGGFRWSDRIRDQVRDQNLQHQILVFCWKERNSQAMFPPSSPWKETITYLFFWLNYICVGPRYARFQGKAQRRAKLPQLQGELCWQKLDKF